MWKTYQSLIFEWIVHTPEEKPEGPEVLEPELQKVIGQKDKSPQKQELDVDQRAEMKKRNLWSFAADIFNCVSVRLIIFIFNCNLMAKGGITRWVD